ncbi:hypothetical protein LUZ60_005943 [Juncus effusus]|nr:hypothetical protein LUZ60_005943 [Juncus effusus]
MMQSRIRGGSVCWRSNYYLWHYEIASDSYWIIDQPCFNDENNERYADLCSVTGRDGEIYHISVFLMKRKVRVQRLNEWKGWVLEGEGYTEEIVEIMQSFPHVGYDRVRKALIFPMRERNVLVAFHLSSSKMEVVGQDICEFIDLKFAHANSMVPFHSSKEDTHALERIKSKAQFKGPIKLSAFQFYSQPSILNPKIHSSSINTTLQSTAQFSLPNPSRKNPTELREPAMAVGKNKRISKGKKGGKKKTVDPFSKKDWYDIKAPTIFNTRNVGKTLVSRTQGTKIASEGLKHRVFEISLADLQGGDEDQAYRKIRLRAEDVQGKNVLTNFWGMDFTTDKVRSLVRKWQTLIEAHVDVKTTDSYTLRMFCIGFTKRRPNQVKRTCYAQSSQVKQIRRKMREIMVAQAASCDLKELVAKFIPESIGKEIEKATSSIFPLQNVFIRKVKILKAPKFDLGKLMEVHGDYKEDLGTKIERPAEDVAMETEAAEVVGA